MSRVADSVEPHNGGVTGRLNRLRAAVLGANDGIVSVAAVVVGVASATPMVAPIATAGAAALIGGAISMALGEYVSVSSSRDATRALTETETRELREDPDGELVELAGLWEERGLSPQTARTVAEELTRHDALRAHLEIELNIDEDDVANPWQAAIASAISFTIGAILPFVAILVLPEPIRIPITFAAVLVALTVTGIASARLSGARPLRPTLRVIIGGMLALGATFAVGALLGATGVV